MQNSTETEQGRPREIKRRHLARAAVTYIRQSSGEQVITNTGSTAHQRMQARYPAAWGWPPDLIETEEDDLGLSGTAAEHRPSYLRTVLRIERDEIGAFFVSDVKRLGRNAAESFRFLELCRIHDVLIVIDGKVYDPNNSTELLITQIAAALAEHDNLARNQTLRAGKLAKLDQGKHVSPPPSGYVSLPDGSWVKDPDAQVQAAIPLIFRRFLEVGTCPKTVKALRKEGIRLPRRNRDGSIRWAEPTVGTLYSLLRNPSYCGRYDFGRRRSDPRAGRNRRGRLRLRWAPPDEVITRHGLHEPYVAVGDWEQAQRVLKLNGPSESRRNLGPGSALVQGIIRCELHRRRLMTTVYKPARADGGQSNSYYCIGTCHEGGPQCGHLSGSLVDRAVLGAVFDRLRPPSLAVLREVVETATAGERSERHREKLDLNRYHQEAALIENRFLALDPGSVEVAKSLEERLERTRREITKLERMLKDAPTPGATFDGAAFDELAALCGDLPTLFHAPTTSHQDRKQIIRTLIEQVLLEHREPECVRLRIQWADGSADTTIELTLGPFTNRIIMDMDAQGLTAEEIADRLNAPGGIPTLRGNPWHRHTVAHKLRRLKPKRGEDRRADDGPGGTTEGK